MLAMGLVFFGYSKTLWHAILGQAIMGAVTGNQGVVSTVLGEITDRSNQSSAFAYLPMIYGVGAVVGPIIGGLLVTDKWDPDTLFGKYPYLLPNLVSAALLVVDFVICIFFLDESLAEAKKLPPIGHRMKSVFTWMWQFTSSSTRPTYLHQNSFNQPKRRKNTNERSNLLSTHDEADESEEYGHNDSGDEDDNEDSSNLISSNVPWKEILTTSNVMMLITYTFFNFGLVAYNSLFPIFVSAKPPTGRGVPPKEIGLSLSFGGVMTILYQVGVFSRLQAAFGTLYFFRSALVLFALTFFAMPFVGYSEDIGKKWLWVELGVVLALKVVATVTCLTCSMMMVCPLLLLPCLSTLCHFLLSPSFALSWRTVKRLYNPYLSYTLLKPFFHLLNLHSSFFQIDHKLCAKPLPAWFPQWIGQQFILWWPSSRTLCLWWIIYARNTFEEGRLASMGCSRWHCSSRFLFVVGYIEKSC